MVFEIDDSQSDPEQRIVYEVRLAVFVMCVSMLRNLVFNGDIKLYNFFEKCLHNSKKRSIFALALRHEAYR